MTKTIVNTAKGDIAVYSGLEQPVDTASDFLDLLANAGVATIALAKTELSPNFFRLQTGLAGDMLQKVSNYRKRLVVLGDYSSLTSQNLKDFIYESNQTGQVVFAATLDEAVMLLR